MTPSVLAARAAGRDTAEEILAEHIENTVDLLLERSRVLADAVAAGRLFRGSAAKYDKTATSSEAAVSLASFLLWARPVCRWTLVPSAEQSAAELCGADVVSAAGVARLRFAVDVIGRPWPSRLSVSLP